MVPDGREIPYADIGDLLLQAIPEFAPQVDEHVDFFGEALPHNLFGDFTRIVEAAWERGESELVRRCLAWLEEMFISGDQLTQDLLRASFVEQVGTWEEEKQEFIRAWPPQLRAEAGAKRKPAVRQEGCAVADAGGQLPTAPPIIAPESR